MDARRTRIPLPIGFLAAFAYFLGPISGVILLMTETYNDYVRFHAWQSCLVLLPMLLLHAIFIWTFVGSIVLLVIDLLIVLPLMFIAFVRAPTLDRFSLPFFGPYAQKMNDWENVE